MSSIMYINLVGEKANLRFNFLYHYNLSFTQTNLTQLCAFRVAQDTDSSIATIAPHWSSSYPEYLSPTWDENMQRAVIWMRVQEHHKLANQSLSKQTERYHALHQEFQKTQAKSSHKLLSRDTRDYHEKIQHEENLGQERGERHENNLCIQLEDILRVQKLGAQSSNHTWEIKDVVLQVIKHTKKQLSNWHGWLPL